MRILKTVGLVLVATFASIVTATSAFAALPELTLLAGEKTPVTAEAEQKGTSTLTTVSGAELKATAVKVKLEWPELSAWGQYTIDLTGVKEGKEACNTVGDAKEVVLSTGEILLVYTSLSPLTAGAIFLFPELTVECGAKTDKIKGSALSSFKGELNTFITSFKLGLKGTKGKPELTKYLVDGEEGKEELTASLSANFGVGFEGAAINIEKELEFKSSKMIDIQPGQPPHWYKEGARIAESNEAGGTNVSSGTGEGLIIMIDAAASREARCKMQDSGKVWNPVGGGAGKGIISSATFTNCISPIYCLTSRAIAAEGLNWTIELRSSGVAVDALIPNIELKLTCNGVATKYKPIARNPNLLRVANGTGSGEAACTGPSHTTWMAFNSNVTGLMAEAGGTFASLNGNDCIWAGTEKISVQSP